MRCRWCERSASSSASSRGRLRCMSQGGRLAIRAAAMQGARRRGRGQGGAHALLPQAGAVDREARVSVGPRRNHDGGHQDEVRGGARALPLPRVRLDRRGHHGGVSADRALAAAGRHARAPAAQRGGRLLQEPCPTPWRRTFRTRTTAASCGASSPTASGSRGSPGRSGRGP